MAVINMKITLAISKLPDGSDHFIGFKYIWLRYIHGFSPRFHCQKSLLGTNDLRFINKMTIGRSFVLEDPAKYKHIYLCGDAVFPDSGLHFALQPQEGSFAKVTTYNGIDITAINARQLTIPRLEEGFAGMPHSYTSCCNWQFGVENYGLDLDGYNYNLI
jgi:hypothetical protein